MLNNKTQAEKSETFLLAHALLLLVLSLLVGVQGVFEIIDYMPHIISAGCVNCGAYVASIPSTLIMYLWFSVSVAPLLTSSRPATKLSLPTVMVPRSV